MKIVQLTDTVSVSEQITPQDIEKIAAAGFKVVVNNRPDGESAEQPASEDIARAAEAAGLSYYYLPINAGNFPGPDVGIMLGAHVYRLCGDRPPTFVDQNGVTHMLKTGRNMVG